MIATEEILDDILTNLALSENIFKEFLTYILFLILFFNLPSMIEIDAPFRKALSANLLPSKFFPFMPKKILFFFIFLESIEASLILIFFSIFFFVTSEIILDFQFLFEVLFLSLIYFLIQFLSEKYFLEVYYW